MIALFVSDLDLLAWFLYALCAASLIWGSITLYQHKKRSRRRRFTFNDIERFERDWKRNRNS